MKNRSNDDMPPDMTLLPERPLRILFHINDFGRGGTETALLAWLNALDRRCFAPGVCVTFPTDDLAFWQARAMPKDVAVHVLADARWMHALHQAQRTRKLSPVAKAAHKLSTHGLIRPLVARRCARLARDYDVVCDFDLSLRRMAGRVGVPWIGFSHYSFSARLGDKPAAYVARRVRQLARYAAIAVLTPEMLREASRLLGGTDVCIEEVPNVIDIDEIRRRGAVHAALPASPFIVSVARLDEGQKDHRTLLHAYAQTRERRGDVPALVIVGDGPDRQALETLAKSLGIGDFVHFPGFCANPFPFIRAAEMLVLSSRYEGFGMVLAEAMALGTPVISADCPTGPRDLLDGGRAGLLVTPGDAGAMAHAIEQLLTDRPLRNVLVANATAQVQLFSPPTANRRMLAVLERIGVKVDGAGLGGSSSAYASPVDREIA